MKKIILPLSFAAFCAISCGNQQSEEATTSAGAQTEVNNEVTKEAPVKTMSKTEKLHQAFHLWMQAVKAEQSLKVNYLLGEEELNGISNLAMMQKGEIPINMSTRGEGYTTVSEDKITLEFSDGPGGAEGQTDYNFKISLLNAADNIYLGQFATCDWGADNGEASYSNSITAVSFKITDEKWTVIEEKAIQKSHYTSNSKSKLENKDLSIILDNKAVLSLKANQDGSLSQQ